jgi:hypothetical protein
MSDDPLKRKKRRMLAFKLDEISGVDRPAQQPALVTLFKRQPDPTPTRQEEPMPQTFTEAVEAIQKRDACTRMVAMQKAREECADLFKAYQSTPTIRKVEPPPQPSADRIEFHKRVAEIQSRDRCGRMQAMQRARDEHPAEFAKYQKSAN